MSLAGREETTLDAIWMKLRDLLDLSPACGPQYELDAEREVLAPNAIVLERITQARAAGCRIVFVSDTYLPVEIVKASCGGTKPPQRGTAFTFRARSAAPSDRGLSTGRCSRRKKSPQTRCIITATIRIAM